MRDIPDAGPIHTGSVFYRGEYKPDLSRCRASVHETGMGANSNQCTRKAKVFRLVNWKDEEVELGYCGQHDPVKVAERNAARNAKWEAEWAAKKRAAANRKAREEGGKAALEALRQIAAGHNDPRSLAREVLEEHGLSADPSTQENAR